ncbi:peroxisomal biogenesis factor 3 [Anabrus simplex]|uniref:peroxisomal biogenesis factor 3 n=1 Tax=Anabrus simplex TaxID=316456 RepID=UPI0035A333A9
MFSSIKSFVNRHRRKFIVTGIVVGSIVVATRYAQKKFREWQEQETKEFMERTRKQQHFESTERTCNQTVLSLAPTIGEAIVKTMNTEEIVGKLRNGHPDKIVLWEELKIFAFTRAAVLVYACTMFVVTLRIQLNLIGGYMFRDSCETIPGGFSNALQEKYLSLCHHFMNQGVVELCKLVQDKVQHVLGNISLKDKLNLHDTEQTFWSLQAVISNDPNDPIKNMARFLLPPDQSKIPGVLKGKDAELLNVMLLETIDILESDEVRSLTSSLVSRGFSHIIDRIAEYFTPREIKKSSLNAPSLTITEIKSDISLQTGQPSEKPKDCTQMNGIGHFVHPNSVSVPMAKLIPIVNGLAHYAGHVDVPDPWIQQLLLDGKLKLLGANIYEAFSNKS